MLATPNKKRLFPLESIFPKEEARKKRIRDYRSYEKRREELTSNLVEEICKLFRRSVMDDPQRLSRFYKSEAILNFGVSEKLDYVPNEVFLKKLERLFGAPDYTISVSVHWSTETKEDGEVNFKREFAIEAFSEDDIMPLRDITNTKGRNPQ